VSQDKTKNNLINWELVAANPNNKNWSWGDLFCFWGINIQSVIGFSLIASLYTVYNLSTFVVFFGTVIGSILVYYFSNLIGKPSQKYGLPFVTILRSSLGYSGSRYFGLLRGLVGIFMFGIQTFFLSKSIGYLIRILFFSIDNTFLDKEIFLVFLLGLNIIDWFSFIISVFLQLYFFSIGINYSRKLINFSAITVYSGMILFFLVILLNDVKLTSNAFYELMDFENFFIIENIVPTITIAGTVFAYFSIIIVSFGDFSRFVKNDRELKKGNLSLILNLIIFSFFAVFIVIGSDIFLKQQFGDLERIFTNPNDIIGKFNNLQITSIVLFFIIIASASTNLVANFIPSQYSLINFFPNKLSLSKASYFIAFAGFLIGMMWPTLLSQIGLLSFIDTFSCFFGPIFGVMVVNYFILNNSNLEIRGIHSISDDSPYQFTGGWHIKGVYSLLIGFIFSASTIWNSSLMFLQSFSWIVGAITASITYYLIAKK
tara:strand:+ start:812 stop:2269 length:1458 start_codon:yes stop_codon:yes gene_type:complete